MLEVAAGGGTGHGDTRIACDRGVAEPLAELRRQAAALHTPLEIACVCRPHGLRVQDVCVGALRGMLRGELHCAVGRLAGLGVVASAPQVVRELGQRACLLHRGVLLLTAPDCLANHLDRLGLVVREVART